MVFDFEIVRDVVTLEVSHVIEKIENPFGNLGSRTLTEILTNDLFKNLDPVVIVSVLELDLHPGQSPVDQEYDRIDECLQIIGSPLPVSYTHLTLPTTPYV